VLMNGNNRKRRETNDDVVNSETSDGISKTEDAKSISIAAEVEPRAEEVQDDDNSTAVNKTESVVTESSPVLSVNPDEVTSVPVVELQTIIPDVPVILDTNQDDNISMSQMTTTAPPVPKPDLRKAEINEVSVNVSSPDELSNNIQNSMAVKNLTSQWKLLYKATVAFRVPDLSPASMFGAVKRMVNETYSGDMFQTYYKHNTAGHKWGTCELDCWRQHLCSITKLVEKEIKTCLNETDKHGFYYEEPNKNETKPVDIIIPSPQEMESSTDGIVIEPRPEDPDSIATRAVSIFFGIVGVLLILLVVFFGYKKYKESRYRNQEFLLTDSVFRYDGYSQLDDD